LRKFVVLLLLGMAAEKSVHPQTEMANGACSEQFFMSYLRNADSSIQINDMAILPGGDFLVCGSTSSRSAGTDGILIRFTSAGLKVWDQVYDLPTDNYFTKIITSRDGNVIVAGGISITPANLFLMKATPDGAPIWHKEYRYNGDESAEAITLREDDNGNIYTTAHLYDNGRESIALRKLDNGGNVAWSKIYNVNNPRLGEPKDFIIADGYSYLTGYLDDTYFLRGMLMKINNGNGNVEWTRLYDLHESSLNFKAILPTDNGFVLCGLNQYYISDTTMFCVVDKDGLSPSIRYMEFDRTRDYEKFLRNADGTIFYGIGSRNEKGIMNLSFARVDLDRGILWMKDYPQFAGTPRITTLYFKGGKVYFSGNIYPSGYTPYSFIARITTNGETGCENKPFGPHFGSQTVIVHDSLLNAFDKPMVVTDHLALVRSLSGWTVDEDCKMESTCDSLNVLPTSLTYCTTGDTVKVPIYKNAACLTGIQFEYDHTRFRMITSDDSLARFLPLVKAESIITAILETDCGVFRDSVKINFNPADSVKLGRDTTLCGTNNILLKAPANYASYLWSDGSTEPTMTVITAGTYNVTATNFCNKAYSDTIRVFEKSVVPFEAGPDRVVCANTVLDLKAADGFSNYRWIASDIVFPQQEFITTAPASETYIALANYGVGCTASDTVRVSLDPAILALGPDTNICKGKDLLLNVPGNFISYRWSTGSTGASVNITETGTYMVEALSRGGCFLRDTINVSFAPCYTGRGVLYPNAFTPNGDGRNDTYSPFVDIPLTAYQFVIYNRWGQTVFESKDPERYWDGTINGVAAANGSYVWQCVYISQIDNTRHADKGVLILIR
jgi:gliding motility-associated-like protein